ncbi:MAG: hypothetical protein CFE24_13925 [Flavobacterium sp. BFFFF2]|nr:MAG: hypothetical protein CFE24_13925 [Flavobacterium sp. BFFFF2]
MFPQAATVAKRRNVMPNYMKTRRLTIYLTLLLAACGQKNNTIDEGLISNRLLVLEDRTKNFSISKTTIENFKRAKRTSKDEFIQDTINVRKINGVTEVPLKKPHYPHSLIFKDTPAGIEETEEKEFNYLGQFPIIGKYLVSGTFWEHYECYLIDKKTGSKTTIWNKPRLSTTSKYFANLSIEYGLEGEPNGIQIWKIKKTNKNNLHKYLELNQEIWVPDDFVWESDNSIIIKVSSVENYMKENGQPKEKDFFYLKLLLR